MRVEREVVTDSVKHKDVFHISGKGWFYSVDDESQAIGPFATEDEAMEKLGVGNG